MVKRIYIAGAVMIIITALLMYRIYAIINDDDIISASVGRGTYTVKVKRSSGYIYDRNMVPLVNREHEYYALINPDTFSVEEVYPAIAELDVLMENIGGHAPFLCRLKNGNVNDHMTPVICTDRRYSENQPAGHIIGYASENYGKCGIEGLYSDFFDDNSCCTEITYSVNALGNVLDGAEIGISEEPCSTAGVVTSLDYDIQMICERAADKLDRGAVVVMDIHTGDIVASVSRPVYDISCLGDYLNDEDMPFINRALLPYSVGSVYKLVIGAAALEAGISEEFSCICSGSVNINGQRFGCHQWAGHGIVDMRTAMAESCNPYFILLGRNLPSDYMYEFMRGAGFGCENDLGGIVCSGGYLPTAEELSIPAEKANICFGQGKLSAAPVQICRFICAVAGKGYLPQPRLIYGTSENGSGFVIPEGTSKKIMSEETADKLKSFMYDALYKDNSVSIPSNTDGGCKTSTAQTGQYDEKGRELLNCWIGGFFPYDEPKYAVVVLAEDGISGNISCGPIFKEIAEEITLKEKYK